MTTVQQIDKCLTSGMRWTARVLGLLASGPFVLFLIYPGARILPKLSWSNLRGMPLFIVLAMAMMSILIAWRWEMIGGAIAVFCAIAITALVYLGSGRGVIPQPR
jgi:hypothetical protein